MRILVVEDNDDGRKMLSLLLELQGHETREASDGMAAIDLALKWRPDAALVDIGLPRMDGYQVARRLRNEFGSRITLIAQTSYGEPEDRALAMAAGFDVHLTKPVDPRELSDHLQIASQRLAGNVRREL